jgi:hypothetical protein
MGIWHEGIYIKDYSELTRFEKWWSWWVGWQLPRAWYLVSSIFIRPFCSHKEKVTCYLPGGAIRKFKYDRCCNCNKKLSKPVRNEKYIDPWEKLDNG